MTHPNETTIRTFYDARISWDMHRLEQTIREVFTDDVIWHYAGRNPLNQDYRGHAGVLDFFVRLRELTRGTFHLTLDDVVANDERGVALEILKAERGGQEFGWRSALAYYFRAGKIAEVRVFQHTQYEVDAFWAL